MSNAFIAFFVIVAALLILAIGVAFLRTQLARLKVESTIQFQCNSGDSEVMVINLNRYRNESPEDLQGRMDDSWGLIEKRREQNHQKWLRVQAEAQKENLAKADLAAQTVAQISEANKKGKKA